MEIIIVDENDIEIGIKPLVKPREDLSQLIYRVSTVWLYNSAGEVLIAQRAFDKYHSPGAWSASAAGMVEVGETYLENAIQETQEEIGLKVTEADLIVGPKMLRRNTNPDRQYFKQTYFAKCDWSVEKFALQEDEVAAVEWINVAKLKKRVETDPESFVDVSIEVLSGLPQ